MMNAKIELYYYVELPSVSLPPITPLQDALTGLLSSFTPIYPRTHLHKNNSYCLCSIIFDSSWE